MKYLAIRNNGVLDIRLVSLMGGTTKSKDKYKIGQFGTGLKYFLAFCVRNNIDFKIFCGEKQVVVTVEQETIKNEIFEIICIDGIRSSITSRMGEDWEAWMIIREIWCNALDEGGSKKFITTDVSGLADTTTIFIQATPEITSVMSDWNKYFIHDQAPIFSSPEFCIYPGGKSFRLYKKGVLIHELDLTTSEEFSIFSYDIADAEINELREFKGSVAQSVAKCLSCCNVSTAKTFLENISQSAYDANIDLSWYLSWSSDWEKAIGDRKLIHFSAEKRMLENGRQIDYEKTIVVPKSLYTVLSTQFPDVRGLYSSSGSKDFVPTDNPELLKRLHEAVETLRRAGVYIHPELHFKTGYFDSSNVLADVNLQTKLCCVSNKLMDLSMFDVITTVLEENAHIHTGYRDETRMFQQYFIDLYTKTLLEKHSISV